MTSVKVALNQLKQDHPSYGKLYELALWLNSRSHNCISLEDDIDKQLDLIKDLPTIKDANSFVALIENYDIFDSSYSDNYGPTLGDIAWGVAYKYFNENN